MSDVFLKVFAYGGPLLALAVILGLVTVFVANFVLGAMVLAVIGVITYAVRKEIKTDGQGV